MMRSNRSASSRRLRPSFTVAALLLAGLLLRIFFLWRHAFLAGDSYLYQDIAQNWLHEHVYGLSTDAAPRPTLIRLPGYPGVLATCDWLFGRFLNADPGTLRSFLPVLWLQIVADLATCWICATIALRMFGNRAAIATLALATLCPFTANYTAVPLTETFTLFFLMLAFLLLQRWLALRSVLLLAALGTALSCNIMLRPDQALLTVAIVPLLLICGSARPRARVQSVAVCLAVAALPFVPWTARNYRTFHVFQPLAPRLANDPGEVPPRGFQSWYRTWAVDFSSTEDAYWMYPEETVNIGDLPSRAFDSAGERATVTDLLQRTGVVHKLIPSVEQGFEQVAQQRGRAHPVRTYFLLPTARLVNMLFHPRVEMLPLAERWWQYRLHRKQTAFAWCFAALNVCYFFAAILGGPRGYRSDAALTLSMVAYIALRCALLLTLDNAEQRYTLEFFPIVFVFAGSLCWKRTERET